MDENNNNNFLDKNTLLAIGLSIVFFIGWQFYLQKKYPESYKKKIVVEETSKNPNSPKDIIDKKVIGSGSGSSSGTSTENRVVDPAIKVVQSKESIVKVNTKSFSGQLSSKGMGFTSLELVNYTDRKNKNIRFSNNQTNVGNFATMIGDEVPNFKITQESDSVFVGVATISGATLIKKMIINDDNYTIDTTLKTLTGKLTDSQKVKIVLSNLALKVESSFLTPAYEGTEFFAVDDGSEERERIDLEKNMSKAYTKTTLASIGSQYFAVGLKDKTDIIPSSQFSYQSKEEVVFATVTYQTESINSISGIQFIGFIGPKKYDILKTIDPDFVKMINYGIFSILSKPILSMLKWLYSLFENWGLAIILLTVFIRILLLPINISSLRSMKKMQKIQPQLKAIKEKYKEDPARVNQETMALMKKEKANPLGGCLPMLLQLPVFFALYSVLGQSVELYKAPFAFWIHDLSYKDPFFVLPIAVGVLYFIQMNLTPQTGMDPTQAKVMKFIPILFCFFMITVPSGLTLYFFVNTVFGIGQQFIFQREKRKAAA